ncbi:prepilin peptidase [Pseudomonas resinovorans]|uniref:A24 family peptidase n=1 Tax=Metapseudomonas resinovorans TaxID=53412 RepID=UPI00237F0E15|nr:prepilin peptidase [Pseudomonas resinovorans]MDE3739685.1 prepilin peptidase [Pseudomonas resinovorans]
MPAESLFAIVVLLGLMGYAVVSDLRQHRIPNRLILAGLLLGLAGQTYGAGLTGLGDAALAVVIGFSIFIPIYALGGMAAGDVKLMAMVGAFLSPGVAIWAALYSLIAGGLCGLLLVLARGQAKQTLARCWLMLKVRTYLAPGEDEVAGKPFPYAVAILIGTLVSLLWLPDSSWTER